MSEQERAKGRREERRKPARPADHRCSVCDKKVPGPLDDDAHVCVPDNAGPVEHGGRRWRATTAREARAEREKKVRDERERGRS